FGMIQWSPNMNSRSAGGNYDHGDNQLRGYALTNLAGPGCGAMGDDPILPMVGGAPSNVNGTMMSYNHSTEVATAGYFSAKSSGGTIQTELTTTQHAGIARITYPSSTQAALLIKLRDSQNQNGTDPSSARIVSNTEIIGDTTSGHFCGDVATYVVHFDMVFDHPFTASQILGSGGAGPTGIFLTFNTTSSKVLMAKVGMSFVSDGNAKANWQSEIPDFNFDGVRAATHAAWNTFLGNNEASLAALLAPKETGDMGTSLMQAFQQSGAIPQWGFMNSFNGVMIGDSAPAIVAQYHAFGARSADDNQLLQDLVHQARVDNR